MAAEIFDNDRGVDRARHPYSAVSALCHNHHFAQVLSARRVTVDTIEGALCTYFLVQWHGRSYTGRCS